MTLLFVAREKLNGQVSPIVQAQMDSLLQFGLNIDIFPIVGKGTIGYLMSVIKLRKYLKTKKYDIIHGHYSLSAFVASFSGAKPLVVSLMGSDVKAGRGYRLLISFFKYFFGWKAIIVKSEEMKASLKMNDAYVIPNGVDYEIFQPMDKSSCQKQLGWSKDKQHVLFAANPDRPEKNFNLALQAIELLDRKSIELHTLINIPFKQLSMWYNAADVVILSSRREGSPNVVKEAMACNRPVVSTDVGNVKWLFRDTEGCFISEPNVQNFSYKLNEALDFSITYGSSKGRQKLHSLKLESDKVAVEIVNVYERCINQ